MEDHIGLFYLRARYYDPKTARFVQVDTNYDGEVDNVGSRNKYIYTLGNPYKYVERLYSEKTISFDIDPFAVMASGISCIFDGDKLSIEYILVDGSIKHRTFDLLLIE